MEYITNNCYSIRVDNIIMKLNWLCGKERERQSLAHLYADVKRWKNITGYSALELFLVHSIRSDRTVEISTELVMSAHYTLLLSSCLYLEIMDTLLRFTIVRLRSTNCQSYHYLHWYKLI